MFFTQLYQHTAFWQYFLPVLIFALMTAIILLIVFYNQLQMEYASSKIIHQKETVSEIQEFVSENMRLQHENKNHMLALFNAVEIADDIEELREEFSKYQTELQKKHLESHGILRKFGRVLVESLIIAKLTKAKSLGIKFTCDIKNVTVEATLEDYVLCQILGCLLDNAIESETDSIIFNAYPTGDGKYTVIEIKNKHKPLSHTFVQQMFQKGFTTKAQSKDRTRGYGLYNVNEVVEKHNIILEVYNEPLGDNNNENYAVFAVQLRS
jgi:sensor histidine kinase regulating citrate/malate metabolism